MTNKEQSAIDQLIKLLVDLKNDNLQFRKDADMQIQAINAKVDKHNKPMQFESDILQTVQLSIQESIKTVVAGYNSPLNKLVQIVVDKHSTQLQQIISDSFNEVIQLDTFKKSIVEAFSHKVARSIISNNDGLFDKVANELKQDSIFKAKMSIAVSNVVNECLIEHNQ